MTRLLIVSLVKKNGAKALIERRYKEIRNFVEEYESHFDGFNRY